MSKLDLTRGKTNVFERTVDLPAPGYDWNLTTVRFSIWQHHHQTSDVLVQRTSKPPNGGIEVLDEHHIRVTLQPSDTLELPSDQSEFDWSLDLEPGDFNRYVLEYGVLEAH